MVALVVAGCVTSAAAELVAKYVSAPTDHGRSPDELGARSTRCPHQEPCPCVGSQGGPADTLTQVTASYVSSPSVISSAAKA